MNDQITPEDFVKATVKCFKNGFGIFANKVNVEDFVPKNKTDREKALFLFYVVQLDYATKSQKLYEGATKLIEDMPNFFSPNIILKFTSEELLNICVKYLKPRYPNEAYSRYRINSKLLLEKYKGNPLEIINSSKTAKEALRKVLEFRGYGNKTGNLLLRTLISVFNPAFEDIQEVLPPVDIHDVRIAYLLGFTENKEMTDKNINDVKIIWNEACQKARENWITFDRALWLLGSQGQPKTKDDVLKHVGINIEKVL